MTLMPMMSVCKLMTTTVRRNESKVAGTAAWLSDCRGSWELRGGEIEVKNL